jgi:hypothetical protein
MAGFYPTNSPYGYVCICRAPDNKTYTQGLGSGSFRFSGDFSDSYDFFRSLRGTFTEPNWYKDIKLNGAYSRLYRRTGNRIYSCLGHVVANYDLKYSIIQLPPEPEQELIDLLKRTNNLGASSVNKG